VALLGRHEVAFAPAQDMRFLQRERQAYHSNAMALGAWDAGEMLTRRLFYSVGAASCWTRTR
jgi:L-serine dehydratase